MTIFEIPYAVSAILFSPFIGSFMGVVIKRLPAGEGFVTGRSRCDHCGAKLAPIDLVPIVSYAINHGKCSYCSYSIGGFHLVIELAAVLVAMISVVANDGADIWISCFLGWWLLTASWIDAEHFELPDALTLPLILFGILINYLLDKEQIFGCALGAALGYGSFRLIAFLYHAVRGREGLGEGDARLLAASGAWLGWEALPNVIMMSAVAGLIFVLGLNLSGRTVNRTTMLPFGPFIAFATWTMWIAINSFEF